MDLSIEERNSLLNEGYEDEFEQVVEDNLDEKLDNSDVTEKEEVVEKVVEQSPADPFDGLPESVAKTLKDLQEKAGQIDSLAFRLKQAESRVGGLTNELHAAKKAAKEVKEAPTQKQIEDAAQDDSKMAALKEDWPEWAEAIEISEKRFTGKTADLLKSESDKVRAELQTNFDGRLTEVQREFEKRLVSVRHRGWEQTVQTPEFVTWAQSQDDQTKQLIQSDKAEDVIEVLDRFTKPKHKTEVEEIAEKRQARLEKSVAPRARSQTVKQKTFADMTPEEQRKHLLKQGYDED